MKPEQKARKKIDAMLKAAGWAVQSVKEINLGASLGVAIKELSLKSGPADYVLFVDRKAVGVIEAKKRGMPLGGVAEQSEGYANNFPENYPHIGEPLPFLYESTGDNTFFRDLRDPEPRSRRVFHFHKPETLREWGSEKKTLRTLLREMPPLKEGTLWKCQIQGITNLEKSLFEARSKALIQMATGSGKTFMAVKSVYRLIKYANAKRILFLVDRNNLGTQAYKEFQNFEIPETKRKFDEEYNVQHLASNTLDPVSKVCISTIQRMYSILSGEELAPELEEESMFETSAVGSPRRVSYNPKVPIETFDFIIVDECHRSIYNLWREVLEYFDAFIIGLTATPSKQTLGFFDQNLVMEYSHERAVADNVNVPYDVYRIKTEIGEKGGKVPAGFYVDKRDRQTREIRWDQLDEPLEYTTKQLDRDVVSPDQIRTVVKTLKNKIFKEIFMGREVFPKTLVFAKSDSHAEDILHIIREEFGKGNDFCKKITYKTTGDTPENLIRNFRNSYNPRVAVTVDMIATGTDIKPIECLVFMRDVKSRVYFEQMKGRGTRTIKPDDLRHVTRDALHKTHFIIVDAVGVCESQKTDSRPLERNRHVPFDNLLMSVALGDLNENFLTSLAGRLSRLNLQLEEKEKEEFEAVAGTSLGKIVHGLLDAIDLDKKLEKAREMFKTEEPSEKQLNEAYAELAKVACLPFDNSELREKIKEIKSRSEQIIDKVSKDKLTFFGVDSDAKDRAKTILDTFKKFIKENKNELDALQIIYSKHRGQRHVTYEQIKELAESIERPPYSLTPRLVWEAYEKLEKSKVRGAGPKTLLTNLVSLLRFAVGEMNFLEPFTDSVDKKFEVWLKQQKKERVNFTPEQLNWLNMIKDHIATSLKINDEDFQYSPFYEKGGLVRAHRVFGKQLQPVLKQLNEVLVK